MKRIIVGISGASGVVYGARMVDSLSGRVESHLIISPAAREIISLEMPGKAAEIEKMASFVHGIDELGAPIASGSFRTDGMVIIPCSVKSLSAVANSYDENLMIRAADVTLKERRPLVLVVRECPLHTGHLELMLRASRMGAIVFPPVPAFYHGPETLDDVIDHTVGKILDLLDVEHELFRRWEGAERQSKGQV
ncbi:MAG: UbiX family flavin prenyltransferase [Deltaproteobacteria bacterium]|nr:UbiX family flavin prenyltransferase [Deltaproteobacteria bacterium]